MRALALDLSKSRTGWAAWHEGWERPRYGSRVLGSEYTTDGEVFVRLKRLLHDIQGVIGFEDVFVEQAINPANLQGFTNVRTIKMATGLSTHVESYAAEFDGPCRVREVHIDTWRIDFVGSGEIAQIKAEVRRAAKLAGKRLSARDDLKEATMARCRQLGFKPRHTDEADAIGILDYSLSSRRITPPWRAHEVLRPAIGLQSGSAM